MNKITNINNFAIANDMIQHCTALTPNTIGFMQVEPTF